MCPPVRFVISLRLQPLCILRKLPTLDPTAMRPPALNPDGQKMRADEVANFVQRIR